jgi:hypothetical protein
MMATLTFIQGTEQVSSEAFAQASFEVVFDKSQQKHIKRFSGVVPTNQALEVVSFLQTHLDELIDICSEGYQLIGAKVIFVHSDVITNVCRVEAQYML